MFCRALLLLPFFTSTVFGAVIPLNHEWTPGTGANKAPPYYVWQNDPALSEFYTNVETKVTNLCMPSSIANAFIYEFSYRKPNATRLVLPGMAADQKSIDGAELTRHIFKLAGGTIKGGAGIPQVFQAITGIYSASGYKNPSIKLIREDGKVNLGDSIEYEDRLPTIKDLEEAIRDGYEIIASIFFMAWDESTQTWIRKSSHALNLYGMEPIPGNSNSTKVYLSNPTRAYHMDFKHPLFDVATLTQEENRLTLTGRLLNRDKMKTVLSGLILMKPE